MFAPSRLKLARQRLGLTLTGLANASGVSPRSLTNFETGDRVPSAESLEKLATALSVPTAFFDREALEAIAPEAASFRKLSKTSATRRDAVLAGASLTVEFYDYISSNFHLPEPNIPTLDKLAPEAAAELVRQRWALGDRPVANLVHLMESKGVRLGALKHQYHDIDAFCFVRDNTPYVLLNTSKSGERQRFDAAHELGHLVLHDELEMDPSTSKERESEANQFASAFLMPRSAVLAQSMRAASLDRVLAARRYWRVSAMALTHRLHELRLLNNWQYRTMCLNLSELGYRSTEPGGIVPETSQLLRKVMYGTAGRVTVRDAANALSLDQRDVRGFVRDLVPVSAADDLSDRGPAASAIDSPLGSERSGLKLVEGSQRRRRSG
ncbi:helix-turn-helix domain-containing protein [Leifsonia sp. 21MFCrub1.1]|uniref:helix-turn-helix domain-containing protein n=1 Tax=Leifsonia sp. 21MFCrub1.1 TaxID=1798223 RepID=UPI000AD2E3AE|nr:XRE family transcriptional regulator [Leifsonia sp. 21MFCrub1.1]